MCMDVTLCNLLIADRASPSAVGNLTHQPSQVNAKGSFVR
jgi:hypothetical protein